MIAVSLMGTASKSWIVMSAIWPGFRTCDLLSALYDALLMKTPVIVYVAQVRFPIPRRFQLHFAGGFP